MKKNKQLTISFQEIPEQGESYSFDSSAHELLKQLEDVVSPENFTAEFTLSHVGDLLQIAGSLKATLPSLCARCAYDFDYPVAHQFKEWIYVQPKLQKNDQQKKGAQKHALPKDDELYCHVVTEPELDVAQFLREQLSLLEPISPLGQKNCDNSCENYLKAVNMGWLQTPETDSSPFANQLQQAMRKH